VGNAFRKNLYISLRFAIWLIFVGICLIPVKVCLKGGGIPWFMNCSRFYAGSLTLTRLGWNCKKGIRKETTGMTVLLLCLCYYIWR